MVCHLWQCNTARKEGVSTEAGAEACGEAENDTPPIHASECRPSSQLPATSNTTSRGGGG